MPDNSQPGFLKMIIALLASLFQLSSPELIVETNSGPIRSVASLTEDVNAFLGVPYAEPPIGDLRFAKPVPKTPWKETYNAFNLPPPCVQHYLMSFYYFMPDITNMSEDCLYLNIWAPKANLSHGLRPIIVYIHHGTFMSGSSNQKVHDGSHLASRGDVIVVTINYRLGSLGFLLAYNEEANGNMGMYDQIMAIKWIKDNAKYFNGDTENIALMGSSAGGISATALILSPLSKNLFKRAFIQSGSLVSPLFNDDNTRLFKNSESIASMVGCSNRSSFTLKSDPRLVVKCLKGKSVKDLAEAETLLQRASPVVFYPRVNDEFLPKDSIALLREGKFRKDVDVILGINKDEGSLFLVIGAQDYLGRYGNISLNTMNKYRAVAFSQGAGAVAGLSNIPEATRFYLKSVKNRTSIGYTKMAANVLGDYGVSCGTVYLADYLSLKGNVVYFYKFGFRAASTPMAEWMGTTHLDELQYVFAIPFHANFTSEETKISNNIIDRWSAFAKTGNPNIPGQIPWLRYSYHNPLYLNIGQEEESIRLRPLDRCEFWRKEFRSEFDSDLIRRLRNSGMNPKQT